MVDFRYSISRREKICLVPGDSSITIWSYFVLAQLNAIHIPQRFDNNTYNYMSDMQKNWPNGSKGKTIEIIRNIGIYYYIDRKRFEIV